MNKPLQLQFFPANKPKPSGFTLIEMVMSLTIVSVIMVSIGSVMVLMSKAIPTEDSDSVIQSRYQRDLLLLKRELEMATEISAITSNSISFTVPDRDSDGRPEELIVSNAGDNQPLVISYNGTLEHQLIGRIDNFKVSLVKDTVNWEITPPVSITGNTTFYNHNPVPNMNAAGQSYYSGGLFGVDIGKLFGNTNDDPTGPTVLNYETNNLYQASYFFTPTLPDDTIYFQIKQISFYARQKAGLLDGRLTVELCSKHDTEDQPSDTVLQSATVEIESQNFTLHTAVFNTPVIILPGQTLHVKIKGALLNNDVYVGYYDYFSADQPEFTTMTEDGGLTWTPQQRWRLPCLVEGVATLPPSSTFTDSPEHYKGVYFYWRDQDGEEFSRTVQFLNAPVIP